MRYQKIFSQIWNDEKFIQLTPEQQRLWFYILTCPHGNITGCYVLKPAYACGDLGIDPKDFQKDLAKLLEMDFVKYDFNTSLILIINFLKHNPITNPNQVKAAAKMIRELPKSPIIAGLKGLIKGLPEGLTEGLPEGLSKPDTDTDTDTEEETEKKSKNNDIHSMQQGSPVDNLKKIDPFKSIEEKPEEKIECGIKSHPLLRMYCTHIMKNRTGCRNPKACIATGEHFRQIIEKKVPDNAVDREAYLAKSIFSYAAEHFDEVYEHFKREEESKTLD